MVTGGPGPAGLAPWPLIGRGDEVDLATEALRHRPAVVLAGHAGVGKTRLARAVLARAEADGADTRWVAATRSAATVPLGAFAHLLPPEALPGGNGSGGTGGVPDGQDGRAALLAAVVRALGRQAREAPLMVGVDDAHLLDDASATLVHLLAGSAVAKVVATVRSGEPTPDPVVALWKDDLALRVELLPLSRDEVADLLARVLGAPVDGATARRLFDVTRGNVLFLRELVAGGRASGALVERSGLWSWKGPLRPGVALRDLIADRLGALDDDERDALELLAVGEPLPAAVLDSLVPAEVVLRLERRALLAGGTAAGPGGRGEVRLDHPLFAEVLAHGMSPRRLDDCRRRLATAWQAAWSAPGALPPDEQLRVATWRADLGDHDDPELLLSGARRALVLGDNATGERLARAAHVTAPTVESALVLGGALHSLGRDDDAIAVWRSGQDRPGSPLEHSRLATGIADTLAWGLGRADEARRVLAEAADRLADDPAAQVELVSMEALLASLDAPTTGQAVEIADRLLARPHLPAPARLRGQLAAAMAWVDAGDIDRAVATGQAAVGEALRLEIPGLALYHAMSLAQAYLLGGRLAEAEALVEGGHELALSAHADIARGAWCFLRGGLAVLRGRPERAAALLRESDLLLGRFDYGLRRGVMIWLAMAESLRGDAAAADRALAAAERSTRSRERLYDADAARAQAWALVAAGRLTDAREAVDRAVAVAAAAERRTQEVLARHDQARFGDPGPAADRLAELAPLVTGALAAACAAHARALADGDGRGLDAAADTFTALGFDLFAAEAQVAAVEAHRRAGQRARASASAERARRLVADLPGATTPLLRGLSAAVTGLGELTAREREVAELAARGRTDRDIAEALFLSVRTVHAHLRSAYAKLGVAGRGELADVLAVPRDPDPPGAPRVPPVPPVPRVPGVPNR
jgi:ATP/maltotriose-dependent transcriptional regulator MalT